jgi:hypothetical protein
MYVFKDEEINNGQDQERVLAESSYEDERTMHKILGQSPNK